MTRFHPRILAPAQRGLAGILGPWATARGFYLAGGTAIALYMGHRESADFDWFGPDFEPDVLVEEMIGLVKTDFHARASQRGTIVGRFGDINLSLFRYRYPLLRPLVMWSGMALASLEDLAAMKLLAVCSRATRRDYVDLNVLMKRFAPLGEMISLFFAKYPGQSAPHLLRSLTFFDDTEAEPMPRMFTRVTWAQVKRDIREAVDRLET